MSGVLTYKEVDFDNISFTPPRKVQKKYYASTRYVKNGKKLRELYFQLSGLKVISTQLDTTNDKRGYIEVDIGRTNSRLYNFFRRIDEVNINNAVKNTVEWFKEELSRDDIEDIYRTPIRLPKNGNRSTLKLNLPVETDESRLTVYNNNRESVDYNEIKESSNTVMIVEFLGLSFSKSQFSPEFIIRQVKINENNNLDFSKYMIIDDEDDEDYGSDELNYPDEEYLTDNEEDDVEEENNTIEDI